MKKFKKQIKNLAVGLAIGMKKGDNLMSSSDLEKNLDTSSDKINPIYHKNSFLKSIQQGQLKEEQKIAFYKQLEVMDYAHGKSKMVLREYDVYNEKTGKIEKQMIEVAEGLSPEEIHKQEEDKQKLGDYIEGYKTVLFLGNRNIIEKNADYADVIKFQGLNLREFEEKMKELVKVKLTLTILREENLYGAIKIEEYCNDIFVKILENQNFDLNKNCIVEFYCANYNKRKNEEDVLDGMDLLDYEVELEDAFSMINSGFNLNNFINFKHFNVAEIKATKNDIIHKFQVESFKEIKRLDKGFVLKFNCVKLSTETGSKYF